jgi:hypothetical protein
MQSGLSLWFLAEKYLSSNHDSTNIRRQLRLTDDF